MSPPSGALSWLASANGEASRDRGDTVMPEKKTRERAQKAKEEGKAPSTQAGDFIREEIHHVREGKHGARSTEQAIAIGLSKARKAGVKVPPRGAKKTAKKTSGTTKKKTAKKTGTAKKKTAKKAGAKKTAKKAGAKKTSTRKPSPRRSAAAKRALRREGRSAASHTALAKHARKAAKRRSAADRSASARKAAKTKGAAGRSRAAKKAAETRAEHSAS
jgi:hypothetical protein